MESANTLYALVPSSFYSKLEFFLISATPEMMLKALLIYPIVLSLLALFICCFTDWNILASLASTSLLLLFSPNFLV